jgi:hypothetical protein
MSWRKPTSFFAACITMPKVTTGVKRPRDTNQVEDREPTPEEQGKDPAAIERGRLGGVKGGSARAANMTAKQRSDSARNAARKSGVTASMRYSRHFRLRRIVDF